MYQKKDQRDLSVEKLMKSIAEMQPAKTNFDKIIEANTVKEIINLHLDPNDVLQLFSKAESLAASYEQNYILSDFIGNRLEKVRPVKRKRAFFI